MTSPEVPRSPLVRFPNFGEFDDLNSLSIVIQDLSTVYDVTAVAVLPQYVRVLMPTTRIGPRRFSPLYQEDRIRVKRLSLASPLEIVLYVVAAVGGARAAKAWLDVLIAGTDFRQRVQKLDEDRSLEPERLREAQLLNNLLEQRVRIETARADVAERIREEAVDFSSESRRGGSRRKPAGQMTSREFAELLNEPMERLLDYGGGELEISSDESEDDQPEPE